MIDDTVAPPRIRSQSRIPKAPAEFFWAKVKKQEGCWLWQARVNRKGYGELGTGSVARGTKQTWLAHRFSWVLHSGEIPPGLFVLHRCDQPACVNPDHRFLGTNADNMADAAKKNRLPLGSRHWNARLTEADIAEIKRRRSLGMKQAAIARQFGVGQDHVSRIVKGKRRRKSPSISESHHTCPRSL